jgi:ornithine cyclodeaminase/alanine dehydrogenase-like protein (mu-crystallin family)
VGVLILGDDEVRELLDMESCIAAMEDVLARLAHEELLNPLRTIMFTPSKRGLGLMPAWRGGDDPVFSLKEIVVAPSNSEIGLDPHQGAVLLHDGTTGKLRAILNASAVTEIRTAAVSAVATKLLARETPRQVAILGSGVQGRSHVEAMRTIAPACEIRLWSRSAANAEALALEAHAHVAASVQEALDGADVVCTCTSAKQPVLELGWLSPGQHLNVVGSSVARAREVDSATMAAVSLFVDRRESTLNEAGDYLVPAAEGLIGPDHIRAELGELLIGAHPGRTHPDEITLFKSLGIAVEDLASAELCHARARERGLGVEVEF